MLVEGQLINSENEIEKHVQKFYTELYNKEKPSATQAQIDEVLINLPSLEDEQKEKALSEINQLELSWNTKKSLSQYD